MLSFFDLPESERQRLSRIGRELLLAEIKKGWLCGCGGKMLERSRDSQFICEPPQCWVRFWCPRCQRSREVAYSDDYMARCVEVWPRDRSSPLRSIPYDTQTG